MGEAFLTRRGGSAASGGVKGAVIGVIFPVGASVSVSNGTKTYGSKDTDGNTAFSVEAGTWTVTAALGEDSANKEVTVNEGNFVTVELNFWHGDLYDTGNEFPGVTGGFEAYAYRTSNAGTMSKSADKITLSVNGSSVAASTAKKIPLSGYNTLKVNLLSAPGTANRVELFVGDSEDRKTLKALADIGDSAGIKTLDVSGVNEDCYVSLGLRAAGGVSYTIAFDKLWLE